MLKQCSLQLLKPQSRMHNTLVFFKMLSMFPVLISASATSQPNIIRLSCTKWGIFRLISDNLRMTLHPIQSLNVTNDIACIKSCMDHPNCKSLNVFHKYPNMFKCFLFNEDQNSDKCSYSLKANTSYYDTGGLEEKVGPNCRSNPVNICGRKRCIDTCLALQPSCIPYEGSSCKTIRKKYWNIPLPNDFYDVVYQGNTRIIYCDMKTDGGGWMLIGHVNVKTGTSVAALEVSIIRNDMMSKPLPNFILKRGDLGLLKDNLPFSQMRLYCHKFKKNKTIHIITSNNASGFAVVNFLANKHNNLPVACGSYYTMEDDNSYLSKRCWEWNNCAGANRWSSYNLAHHPIAICNKVHIGFAGGRPECDDFVSPTILPTDHGVWVYYLR